MPQAEGNARDRGRHCLVLTPRGRMIPNDLLNAMQRASIMVREVGDVASALVQLARRRYASLVMIERESIAGGDRFIEVVRRYYPRVHVWSFDSRAHPALARIQAGLSTSLDPRSELDPTNERSIDGASLRNVDDVVSTSNQIKPIGEVESMDVRLSDEEVSMLLDDSPEDSALDGPNEGLRENS